MSHNFLRQTLKSSGLLFVLAWAMSGAAAAQTATTSPTPEDVMLNGYKVTAASEFGWRWKSLDGNENKYRSDLNYKQGFRTFDTNIVLESESGKGKYFDGLYISNTGWGADPTGNTRVNMEKTGIYKFDANVRRVNYYNNLANHALGEHTQNTKHTFGDFDVTFAPQNDRFRVNAGMSFSNNKGPGTWTARAYGDEFPVSSFTRTKSTDWRIGAEGRIARFNWGLSQGFRLFKNRSFYEITAPNVGNNPAGTSALATFSRTFPTEGRSYFTQGHLNRTFAQKLDFTARLIYTSTVSDSSMFERITGRDASNNFIDFDRFDISAQAKRIQTRGDFGLTYRATDNFRISNTFGFDKFSINGDEAFEEQLFRRNAAGNPLAPSITRSRGYRVNDYERFVNTLEGDYQFNNRASIHLGWRFTKREVNILGFDRTLTAATSPTNPLLIDENESNQTHTLIAGMKIKPTKHWAIYWDVEHGSADNVFTRLENYKFTNFRVRSRLSAGDFVFNVSAISKDNENPSMTLDTPPRDFGVDVTNRFYSGTVDWDPMSALRFSGGYTYHHLTSEAAIRVPVGGNAIRQGISQFYMRDHYAFVEVAARLHRRLSFFGAYRINRDKGQGSRFSTRIEDIIASYPMQFKTPEARAAIRLSRNVDWNVGYQYFDYRDSQTPIQNYRAHLPFTSLRIYFGGGAADR